MITGVVRVGAGWFAAAVVAGVLAPGAADNNDAQERKRLTGTWEGWVVQGRGERPSGGPVRIAELVITADKIHGTDGRQEFGNGSYRLDLAQNPRVIDAIGIDGQVRNKTFLGIYELQGDTLRWCSANPGKPRPTEFITRPGGGQFLMVLTRKKG